MGALKIMIGTDMSARSDRAVQRGLRIAREQGVGATVVHVLDDAMPKEILDEIHEKKRMHLQRFVDGVAGGVPVTIETPAGDPSTDMVRIAKEAQPDLLVLGTHRPRAFLDAFRETTVQRIVRLTHCSALVVADRDDHPYQTIVAACDFSPAANAAIALAHDLAPGASIQPLHAYQVPYSGRLARAADTANALEASFRREVEATAAAWTPPEVVPSAQMSPVRLVSGAASAALHAMAHEIQADLICLGAHGKVGAAPAILGSVANDLVLDPPCDVLVARPARAG